MKAAALKNVMRTVNLVWVNRTWAGWGRGGGSDAARRVGAVQCLRATHATVSPSDQAELLSLEAHFHLSCAY